MTPSYKKTLKVENYDAFRDIIPTSGIFDMLDCSVEIWCPEHGDTSEVQRMVSLIESMINVTDVRIGSQIEDMISDSYRIVVTESPRAGRGKFTRER